MCKLFIFLKKRGANEINGELRSLTEQKILFIYSFDLLLTFSEDRKYQPYSDNCPVPQVFYQYNELLKEQPKEEPKKKKTVKKIIKYVEESDDDDAEEIEEVIVKKNDKIKPVPQQNKQPENQYADLLYNSSLERMQTKMLNERAKTLISNVMPCYF